MVLGGADGAAMQLIPDPELQIRLCSLRQKRLEVSGPSSPTRLGQKGDSKGLGLLGSFRGKEARPQTPKW